MRVTKGVVAALAACILISGCSISVAHHRIFIERVRRGSEILTMQPGLVLQAGDLIAAIGHHEALLQVMGEGRREVFDRVGRFDERFPFEYEETEWEDRVRARGLQLRLVPRSRVRHLWGASAAASSDVAARRAESRRVYRSRRYGWLSRAILMEIS